jgi:transcriptional regulator with XRE-family HTH domain
MKISQAQVAELAQIAQQSVARFEAGEQIPLDRTKVALAKALGTTPDALFPWPPMADLVNGDAA